MTDGGASSESALRTAVLSLWVWGCHRLDECRQAGAVEVLVSYLCGTVLARRAHYVVSARRSDIAHAIFACTWVIDLGIVFDLWWGQPRAFVYPPTTRRTSV